MRALPCIGAALVVAAGADPAAALGAACWIRPGATVFSDSFRKDSYLAAARHVAPAEGGGITVTPAEQAWSFPDTVPFAAGELPATLEIRGAGTRSEVVTLWQRIYEPGAAKAGAGLRCAARCTPGRSVKCALDPAENGVVNGIVYPGGSRRDEVAGLGGFPYLPRRAGAAGWDTRPSSIDCYAGRAASVLGGIAPFEGAALLSRERGPGPDLAPGEEYSASFSIAAAHDGSPSPYVEFGVFEDGAPCASLPARESEIGPEMATEFSAMTKFSVVFTPAAPGSSWDFRVVSRTGNEKHCTILGPVYVTAQRGRYLSPVFDSLSDRTAWERIEWEVDQCSAAADPSCACPTPGSPLAPVAVGYGVESGAEPAVNRAVPLPHPDKGIHPIPAAAGGRYFRLGVEMLGRENAGMVDAALAPGAGGRRFSGWRPELKSLKVRYFARAAAAESVPIAPSSILRWTRVVYEMDASGGAAGAVDVLAEDGRPLALGVPPGFPLGSVVDAYGHPAIRLRVRLESDPADPGNRAALRFWRVEWEGSPERLILDRNEFRPAGGETVRGLLEVELGGPAEVRVHDAARRPVAELYNGQSEARAVAFEWNGRDGKGKAVPPGTYLITGSAPRGAGTRKVVVRR